MRLGSHITFTGIEVDPRHFDISETRFTFTSLPHRRDSIPVTLRRDVTALFSGRTRRENGFPFFFPAGSVVRANEHARAACLGARACVCPPRGPSAYCRRAALAMLAPPPPLASSASRLQPPSPFHLSRSRLRLSISVVPFLSSRGSSRRGEWFHRKFV